MVQQLAIQPLILQSDPGGRSCCKTPGCESGYGPLFLLHSCPCWTFQQRKLEYSWDIPPRAAFPAPGPWTSLDRCPFHCSTCLTLADIYWNHPEVYVMVPWFPDGGGGMPGGTGPDWVPWVAWHWGSWEWVSSSGRVHSIWRNGLLDSSGVPKTPREDQRVPGYRFGRLVPQNSPDLLATFQNK